MDMPGWWEFSVVFKHKTYAKLMLPIRILSASSHEPLEHQGRTVGRSWTGIGISWVAVEVLRVFFCSLKKKKNCIKLRDTSAVLLQEYIAQSWGLGIQCIHHLNQMYILPMKYSLIPYLLPTSHPSESQMSSLFFPLSDSHTIIQ